MCGIAGIFELDASRTVERSTIHAMTEALAHRGPDGSGFYQDRNVALGFRRLALNDFSAGAHPFTNEDRSVASICNGELYNYSELKQRLSERGHILRTTCDCEILPHLYEEYGAAIVDHLDGQFALAVYDRSNNRLLLARDHFGIQPLFYALVGKTLLFASEIKALLKHPLLTKAVNLTGLDQVLCFPGLVSPATMFRGVRSLPSGHRLLASANGIEVSEYWDLEYPRLSELEDRAEEDACVEGVYERLAAATEKRATAEAEVGVYISGGLDSAIVAGVCASKSRTQRRSFSVLFPNGEMDEARHQRQVVQHAGTAHHEVVFKPADVVERLPMAIYHAECPLKETYNTACLALSQEVRNSGVKAVLTGQGADELFAGYIGYKFDKFNGDAGEKAVDETERRIRETLWGDFRISYEANYSNLARLKRELYSGEVLAELDEFDAFHTLPINRGRLEGRHPVHQRSYLDFKLRLADHLLSDHGDRMSMANGIEMRHPFLDRSLVDFLRCVPPEMNLKNFEEKYILRRAAAKVVPSQIIQREKFGWFAPGTPTLLRSQDPWVDEMLSPERIRRQGYFNVQAVERIKAQYRGRGFRLNQPFEADLLAIILTFNVFLDVFDMPGLN